MKIVCGISHAQGGILGLDENSYFELKSKFLPKIKDKKILFMFEGANIGLLTQKHNQYKEMVQGFNPKLLKFCIDNKADLLMVDQRCDISSEVTEYLDGIFQKRKDAVAKAIDTTSSIFPRNISDLHRKFQANEVTLKFKPGTSDETIKMAKDLHEDSFKTDSVFIENARKYESMYDAVVLMLGCSHIFHMKYTMQASDFEYHTFVGDGKQMAGEVMFGCNVLYYV